MTSQQIRSLVVVAALADLEEAEEEEEVIEVVEVEPVKEKVKIPSPGPRSSGARRKPRRGKSSRSRETDEER